MPPVGAAIAAIGSAIGGAVAAVSAFAAGSFIGSLIVNTAISVGISLIARALSPKPKIEQRGIQTAVTTTGGTTPQAFILGRTATAGQHVCPPMSHKDGDTPNGFLTYVIELSDIPGISLSRVILNDGYSDLGSSAHSAYGFPLLGQRAGSKNHAWVKFYDGSQTAADPMLVQHYASYPDRPWSSSFVGHGTAYAILTFRYNREIYNSLPQVRFELDGIALYDPRFDSTVGGTGPQRWAQPATWTRSANPAVMIYNILRGIQLPSGDIWGGDVPADDLPLDNWFAAMNACDAPIGGRPSFEAGLEVKLEMDPAEVIEELAKTCLGQISEMGGVFRMRVGAPAAPVQFITDEDIVISAPQQLDPFPGLAASVNAIFSDYPEPASLWLARAAPPVLNSAWEAQDGGRRLPSSLNFPACSNLSQVAQLMTAYARDARRFRVHRLVLPPKAFLLEPLDTIAWTSQRNGYANKIFEVVEILDQPGTINQDLILRERDPGDYGWSASDDLPAVVTVTGLSPRPAQVIEGWSVSATTVNDAFGFPRRPAIQLSWIGEAASDARFVRYEIRLTDTSQTISTGLAERSAGTVLVSDGILPATAYQVRGRYVLDRPTAWSSWLDVTTPSTFLSMQDLEAALRETITRARDDAVEANTRLDGINSVIDADITGALGPGGAIRQDIDTTATAIRSEIEGATQTVRGEIETARSAVKGEIEAPGSLLREAIVAMGQSVGDSVQATLSADYYTITAADLAISGAITAFENRFVADNNLVVTATLTQDYYTRTATDGAISAAITSFGSSFGADIQATLDAGYYTKSDADGAISAATTSLRASMEAANGSVGLATAAASAANALASSKGRVIYSTTAPAAADRLAQNLWIDTSGGANTPKRWTGSAWTAVTDKAALDAATEAGAALGAANAKGKVIFSATTPAAADRLAQNLWIDTSGGNNTPKRWNGSAWVAVTDKVAADAKAAVDIQSAVLSNLNGNVARFTAVTSAGGQATAAGIEVVSWNTSGQGTGSAVRLLGDNVIVPGSLSASSLTVTDMAGNLVPNGALRFGDLRGWSAVHSSYQVVARDDASGTNALRTAPTPHVVQNVTDGSTRNATLEEGLVVKPGDRFVPSLALAAGGSSPNIRWQLEFLFRDANGSTVATVTRSFTRSATTWANATGAVVEAPANAATLRLRLRRSGGGSFTGTAFVTNIEVLRQRDGATLITPNSITTDQIFAQNLSSLSADMGEVTAGRIRSADSKFVIDLNAKTITITV
jgi:hypothetical protein